MGRPELKINKQHHTQHMPMTNSAPTHTTKENQPRKRKKEQILIFFPKKSSFGHPEKPHRSSVIFTTFVSKIDLFLSKSCLVIHNNPINYATTMFKKTSFLPQIIAKTILTQNFIGYFYVIILTFAEFYDNESANRWQSEP
jgi:hypothetical protein